MSKALELLHFFTDYPATVKMLLSDAEIDNELNRDRISLQDMLTQYDDLIIERISYVESGSAGSDGKSFQVFEFRFLDRKLPILIKIDYWEYSYGSHTVDKVKVVKKVPVQSYRYEVVEV